jgi:ATP/maltotriose-dependent transcriptional regulator MalT
MIGVKDRIITGNAQDSFHAVTFFPNPEEVARKYVPRPRLLELLNRPPVRSSASVLVAPTGFGKTTLAQQWAADTGAQVQVVYVRRPKDVPLESVDNPSPFGVALANLLNAVTFHAVDHTEDEIRELLDLVLHFSRETPSRFVLDDLEFVNYERVARYVGVIGRSLMEYRGEHGLFIARSVSPDIMSAFNRMGTVRVLLPQQLAFDDQEAEAAHDAGVFGTASLEQVLEAREHTGGWLGGMLAACGGHDGKAMSQGTFDSIVLNEIVQKEYSEPQHMLVASAFLPRLTMPLWEHLFAKYSPPAWQVRHVLAQLPHQLDAERIVFPDVLTASLRRMATFITESQQLRQLLVRALEWYVANDDFESARELATSQHLVAELLRHIKPVCKRLAAQEDWQQICFHLRGVPQSAILQDPDYTFWMFHVLANEGSWSDTLALHGRVSAAWEHSPDPLDRGRDLLMKSWAAHAVGQYQEALAYSENAYNVLPPDAHQERMYAASTAGISQSQINLSSETSEWQRRVAHEMAFLPESQRWWHTNVGPLAFERLAQIGRLTDAYELAARQSAQLVGSQPALATRYVLLMALIDIERLRLDSAELLISRARECAESRPQEQFTQIVESMLYEAREDFDTANHLLSAGPMTAVSRLDFRFRQNLSTARVALAYGDAATADVLLSTVAWPTDPWPRRFGDPHPWLLQALVYSLTGRHDEAIEHAERTLEEAKLRNHTYQQVSSRVTLAYLYHEMGDREMRDHEIGLATATSGGSGFQRAFYVRGQDVRMLVNAVPSPPLQPATPVHPSPVMPPTPLEDAPRLTARERELIGLLSAGYANREIADELYISLSTVKNHLANVYEKLGARNRGEATRIARELGLIGE